MSCDKYKTDHNIKEKFIILSFGVYNSSDKDEIVNTFELSEDVKNIFRDYINISFLNDIKDYGFDLEVYHIIFTDSRSIDVIASYTERIEDFSDFTNLHDAIDVLGDKSIWQVTFSNGKKTVNSANSGKYKFEGLGLTYCK